MKNHKKFVLNFVKKLQIQKICRIFVPLFENAKFRLAVGEAGKTAITYKSNDIGRFSSGSRFTTLLNFANSWEKRSFFYCKIFNPKMRSSVKNVENVNISVETGVTYQSGTHTPEMGNTARNSAKASKTQTLSSIMSEAWRFFRVTGVSFAECLRRAWRNARLAKRMLTGIVEFHFEKVSGEIRQAFGTLLSSRIPETGEGNRKKNEFVFTYWDTEKASWRSFKRFNLVSIA